MKSYSAIVSLSIFLACSGCGPAENSTSAERTLPEANYAVHHGWPSLPEGHILGFVSGVEIDSHGHIFTLHTFRKWLIPFPEEPEPEPLILMWNADGMLANSWGADTFRMPHGLSIDGNDNVWVTDVARNQVLKFSHDGELLMALGEDGVEGWDRTHFGKPSDVEFGPDGSVYVSDGYENCRIVNFTPEGQYQFEWGECGDGVGQFDIPHDLAIDREGIVYVADRENDRIQVFEPDGSFIMEWRSGGKWRPTGLSVSSVNEEIFMVDGGEQPAGFPHRSSAFVLDFSGNQIAEFGRYGNQDGQFMAGHDITVSPDGFVYVVDIAGRRLQRFSRSN